MILDRDTIYEKKFLKLSFKNKVLKKKTTTKSRTNTQTGTGKPFSVMECGNCNTKLLTLNITSMV